MREQPITIGIIGAGGVTSGSHLPVLVNIPDVVVTWICDRSLATATSVARSYHVPNAFERIADCPDVDVVLVATPVGSRRDVVPQVLSRGWHAFCEKPFALTLSDHDAFLDEAARRHVEIGVAQVRRYAKPTIAARKILHEGVLGPIQRVCAAEGFRMHGTGRGGGWHLADQSAGGGVLAEMGSHLIDQMLYSLGATAVRLRGRTQRVHLGLDLATSLVADITLSSGATVGCRTDVSLLEDLCGGIFVEFPACTLRIGLAFDDTLTIMSKDGRQIAELAAPDGAGSTVQGFYLEWMDFLNQCRTGARSAVDARSVRQTTALIEAGSHYQAPHGEPPADADRPLAARDWNHEQLTGGVLR